ncbi:MAG TPA: hypothetical protein VF376_14935 [Thermoanaerobaculia bacterium]
MNGSDSYAETFQPLVELRQSRLRRVRTLPVIDHARFGGPTKTGFGTPGSLIFFMGKSPEETKKAKEALKEGEAAMKQLLARISAQRDRLHPGSLENVVRSAVKQPVLGALSYSGVPILDPIWLPRGLDLTMVAIPYSGGRLIREGFQFVEYINSEDAPSYSAFLLKSAPMLTRAERVALAKVPKHHRTMHVGHGHWCDYTTLAAVAGAVVGATVAGAVGAVAGNLGGAAVGAVGGAIVGAVAGAAVDAGVVAALEGKRFRHHLHLSGDDIRKLGPSKSAQELVKKRRDAMRKAYGARRKKHG